uniref:Uncharacterized protein n=1 Tax=Chromera velia CCMP2878 TaxID=1169474 RepID=A0A0G4GXE5_9ALVE|eukprot:Cvel_23800.t1-p1 / transcript=Cvel_23800.t1 / gene=Cvel_23800 / organism=Chromera_velia_CCMP2878 / gene_product=hypothetical protein / transcript_product=hypothetical protein / location=Cvel_scaffold2498:16787-21616(-) / protein_length=325 / sequence_SO=supercontig / SO=protein_coding / is_pseudo=false
MPRITLAKPETFTGRHDQTERFIMDTDDYFINAHVPHHRQLGIAKTFLSVPMRNWFDLRVKHGQGFAGWPALREVLRGRYKEKHKRRKARKKVLILMCKGFVTNYNEDFSTLALKILGANELDLVDDYIEGLPPVIRTGANGIVWVWCSSEAYGVATTSPRDSVGSVGQQTETASLFAVWRAGPSGLLKLESYREDVLNWFRFKRKFLEQGLHEIGIYTNNLCGASLQKHRLFSHPYSFPVNVYLDGVEAAGIIGIDVLQSFTRIYLYRDTWHPNPVFAPSAPDSICPYAIVLKEEKAACAGYKALRKLNLELLELECREIKCDI